MADPKETKKFIKNVFTEAPATQAKVIKDKPEKERTLKSLLERGFILDTMYEYGLDNPILYEAVVKYAEQSETPKFCMIPQGVEDNEEYYEQYGELEYRELQKFYSLVVLELEAVLDGKSKLTIAEVLEYGHSALNESMLREILDIYKQGRFSAINVMECLNASLDIEANILEFSNVNCE